MPVLYFTPRYFAVAGTVEALQLAVALEASSIDKAVGIHIQLVVVATKVSTAKREIPLFMLFGRETGHLFLLVQVFLKYASMRLS